MEFVGLPDDAIMQAQLHPDPDYVWFLVYSDTFPGVPDGEEIPILDGVAVMRKTKRIVFREFL